MPVTTFVQNITSITLNFIVLSGGGGGKAPGADPEGRGGGGGRGFGDLSPLNFLEVKIIKNV